MVSFAVIKLTEACFTPSSFPMDRSILAAQLAQPSPFNRNFFLIFSSPCLFYPFSFSFPAFAAFAASSITSASNISFPLFHLQHLFHFQHFIHERLYK
jgi:hypothetical protein